MLAAVAVALLSLACSAALPTLNVSEVHSGGAVSADQVRERFLAGLASNKQYTYLKRVAAEAQKKRAHQQRKATTANSDDVSVGSQFENPELSDFLYQGDILLTQRQAQMVNFTKDLGKQRKAGGKIKLQGGKNGPLVQKWPHGRPICYKFGTEGRPVDRKQADLARSAFKFWTENSCLEWKENCEEKPVVMVSEIGGCFTSLGPDSKGIYEKPNGEIVSDKEYADTMPMSLNWDSCGGFWNAPAHEAAHAMGLSHEMSRPDRDEYIKLALRGHADQYIVTEDSETYGTAYDYGSNMHYQSTLGSRDGKTPTMVAKEPKYQHSMGSSYGPVFLDVFVLNKYNDCIKDGISCENGGFPHPRAPQQKCYCPEGFAGKTCADREPGLNGAPAGCGETLKASFGAWRGCAFDGNIGFLSSKLATSEWQTLEIDGPAAPDRKLTQRVWGSKVPYAERAAACTWWIKAAAGKKVEVRVDSLEEKFNDQGSKAPSFDCSYQGIEVKYGDMKRSGPRVCAPGHEKELGTVTSNGPLAVIRHWTIMEGVKATISYRST
ncbi:metalloproteinase [Aphelenchoides avenae]|nr:metalloproteinase [Aphelenchus avenae]